MRISIVGSGRVATHFAKALSKQHHIVQIYSRDLNNAQRLAQQVSAQAIDAVHCIEPAIDLLIIAVSDQAIAQVIQTIHSLQ